MKASKRKIANVMAKQDKLKAGKPKVSRYAAKLEAEQKRMKGRS